MKMRTQAELEKMKGEEVYRLAADMEIEGRSKMRSKKERPNLIHAILVAQTKRIEEDEKKRTVKKLEDGAWRKFVERIQGAVRADATVIDKLEDLLADEHPDYHRGLIRKSIDQALGYLLAEKFAHERIDVRSFGTLNPYDVADLAVTEWGVTLATAKAAVMGVVNEAAKEVARTRISSRDADKDTYVLTKEVAGGFIDRTCFWALKTAVAERQAELRAEAAERAEEAAAAEAKARAEVKTREKEREENRKARLAEIWGRKKVHFVFTGCTTVLKAIPTKNTEEAQMLTAEAGKPIFVFMNGEVVKVANNPKNGRLESKPVSCRMATETEVRADRTRRKGIEEEPEDNSICRVRTIERPKTNPVWLTMGDGTVVKAAVIVNAVPSEFADPFSYVNAAYKYLWYETWVAVANGRGYMLFGNREHKFVACGTAQKATLEEKRAGQAAAKAKGVVALEAPPEVVAA